MEWVTITITDGADIQTEIYALSDVFMTVSHDKDKTLGHKSKQGDIRFWKQYCKKFHSSNLNNFQMSDVKRCSYKAQI